MRSGGATDAATGVGCTGECVRYARFGDWSVRFGGHTSKGDADQHDPWLVRCKERPQRRQREKKLLDLVGAAGLD